MKKRKRSDWFVDSFIYSCLAVLCVITVIPFLQVVTLSVSPSQIAMKYGLHLFPTAFDFSGYVDVFKHKLIWTGYRNTVFITAVSTILTVFLTLMAAYPLSKKYFPNRKLWTGIIVFTMYFQGGLIPTYILVVKYLNMRDSILSLILPSLLGAYTLLIVRNFLVTIPESMEESARLDGANDFVILLKIIIPLSMPVIATVSLWSGVSTWNSWFDCMIYINSEKRFVLQYILRRILLEGQVDDMTAGTKQVLRTDTIRMATLVVATIPIICVYPFLQKYFIKGMLIGSVKG